MLESFKNDIVNGFHRNYYIWHFSKTTLQDVNEVALFDYAFVIIQILVVILLVCQATLTLIKCLIRLILSLIFADLMLIDLLTTKQRESERDARLWLETCQLRHPQHELSEVDVLIVI